MVSKANKKVTTKPPAKKPRKPIATRRDKVASGQSHRESAARAARENSVSVRDIGPLPSIQNPGRRARGQRSLEDFCDEYFPGRFRLPFGDPHYQAIEAMERCTDRGGRAAIAMPRGTGKTTIAEVAVLRAVLYGFRRFVVLVCAIAKLAARRLKSIIRELERNDALLADFPEACWAVRKLERIYQRAQGQLLDGVPTNIEINQEGIILPTVDGAASSGAVIQIASMDGAIRGMNVSGPDGEQLRPDLVILDDVQTRESAKSPIQTTEREAIVCDDVLGLAGPDSDLSAVMLCTVIYPEDLSDRFLSHERHPDWQGIRTRMIEAWPERMDLWDEYSEVWRESWKSGDEGRRAKDYYIANRAEMDRGAVVSWPQRLTKGDVSALQSALNLYFKNPRGFKSEYQNEPETEAGAAGIKSFMPISIGSRVSGAPRCLVPADATRVVAFIDCGSELLWYTVAAFDPNFGGSVIDYGCWPRQARSIFYANDPRPGLSDAYPDHTETERLYAGLNDLVSEIVGKVYYRAANRDELRIGRLLIDAGWNTATVYQFVRQCGHPGIVYPSKGIARTTTSRGVSEWKPRPGEQSGWHWRMTSTDSGRGQQVQFDPDAWKSFLHERLSTKPGGRGCLMLFGAEPSAHEMFCAHLASETAEPVSIRGLEFEKWNQRAGRPDNHMLDTTVGCLVAAASLGLSWSASGTPIPPPARKPRTSYAERFAAKNPTIVGGPR